MIPCFAQRGQNEVSVKIGAMRGNLEVDSGMDRNLQEWATKLIIHQRKGRKPSNRFADQPSNKRIK